MNYLIMTKVFVEQSLASPGSDKNVTAMDSPAF